MGISECWRGFPISCRPSEKRRDYSKIPISIHGRERLDQSSQISKLIFLCHPPLVALYVPNSLLLTLPILLLLFDLPSFVVHRRRRRLPAPFYEPDVFLLLPAAVATFQHKLQSSVSSQCTLMAMAR